MMQASHMVSRFLGVLIKTESTLKMIELLGTSLKTLEFDQQLVTKSIAIRVTFVFPYGFRMILSVINQ